MLLDEATLRKLERLNVAARRAFAGQMQGERRSPKRGQSVEFADYRPYSPGDDFRRIDWNAYARLERFFIKLFVEQEDQTVYLLVDASPSMDWGNPNKLAFTLRAAAALGYIALAGLDRVTVEMLGVGAANRFPPQRGKRSAMALFSFLEAHLPPSHAVRRIANPPNSPAAQLSRYAPPSPGPLILLSDLFEAPRAARVTLRKALSALAARGFSITVLHILSPDEINPALEGDLKLLDCESGAAVEITADYDLLARYQRTLTEWQTEWRAFCAARGITYIPVETTLSLDALLFAWLRRYAVIR